MINAIFGKKGSGKTKKLIDLINESVSTEKGNIIFISDDNSRMFDLDHRVRLIDISQFGKQTFEEFFGFICGVISQDFDISHIFVDRLLNIVGDNEEKVKNLFNNLEELSKKFGTKFTITVSKEEADISVDISKYCAE